MGPPRVSGNQRADGFLIRGAEIRQRTTVRAHASPSRRNSCFTTTTTTTCSLSALSMAAESATASSSLSSSSQKKSGATNMPPGMVMGPDGKPCRVCSSGAAFRNWKPGTTNNTEANSGRGSQKASNASTGTGGQKQKQNTSAMGNSFTGVATAAAATTFATDATTASTASQSSIDGPPANCPADAEQLGRATWTFLHTTAAYYPEKPTPTQRANMLMLLRSLPVLYPCTTCADDFGEDLKRNPPDVSGRLGLSRWLCERHNEVNEKLGKEKFDCRIEKVDERWKDGPADGSCD